MVNVSPRWQAVLDKWQVQTILALRASPLTETLQAQGGWQLVFTEREAVVFVRETDANRPLRAPGPAIPRGRPRRSEEAGELSRIRARPLR